MKRFIKKVLLFLFLYNFILAGKKGKTIFFTYKLLFKNIWGEKWQTYDNYAIQNMSKKYVILFSRAWVKVL